MKKRKEEEQQDAVPNKEAEAAVPASEAQAQPSQDYYDQLLRLKADFENYRKRVDREKPELIAFGRNQVLCGLLPLYDTLLNARKAFEKLPPSDGDNGSVAELRKGVSMVYGELEKLLSAEGIKCIECVGKPFDPMCHEVMGVVEDDERDEGLVHDELQRGFMAGAQVLRPSRVRITRKKTAQQPVEPAPEQETESEQN